jgi:hypothetical protein
MENLVRFLEPLNLDHRRRLSWFVEHAGQETGYPPPLENDALLASKRKSIYKPKGWDVPLSVRVMNVSPYRDGEVLERADGSWCLAFHQENTDIALRDTEYTNRAMNRAMALRVPIGVIKEVPRLTKSGRPRYWVLGVAVPIGWEDGYYLLEGFGPAGANFSGDTRSDALEAAATESNSSAPETPPDDDYEARVRVMRQIVARRGQGKFRERLLSAYGNKCVLSDCDVPEVLEAAHLLPYRGPDSNVVTNGILLRGDLHTLLDLQLIGIDPGSRIVTVSVRLRGSRLEALDGLRLREPIDDAERPSVQALEWGYRLFLAAEQTRNAIPLGPR